MKRIKQASKVLYSVTSSAYKPPTGADAVDTVSGVSLARGLFTLANVNERVTRATEAMRRVILVFIEMDLVNSTLCF
jgi:hypothetical protein